MKERGKGGKKREIGKREIDKKKVEIWRNEKYKRVETPERIS